MYKKMLLYEDKDSFFRTVLPFTLITKYLYILISGSSSIEASMTSKFQIRICTPQSIYTCLLPTRSQRLFGGVRRM